MFDVKIDLHFLSLCYIRFQDRRLEFGTLQKQQKLKKNMLLHEKYSSSVGI